jgi:septal ring factor EnvC (AmiA/AmiB activator)
VLVAACTLLAAAAGQAAAAPSKVQESRDRLKEVQRELGRERAKAKEAGQREATLAKELERLDQDLVQRSRSLRDLEAKLRGSSQRLAQLSQDIAATDRRLTRSKGLLRQRLRALYKQGRFGYVRMLLSADDLAAAGRRLKYLAAVAAQDRRLIDTYSTSLSSLSEKRAELERYKAEVADAKARAATTRGQIAEEQRKRRILLASTREEKAGYLASIKELERSAKDLQSLLTRLQSDEERQRRASRAGPRRDGSRPEAPADRGQEQAPDLREDGRFAQLKGRLPWPAAGTLSSTFGRQEHPKFHTVTFNRGIEIAAPEGRDIVAVADGTVIYADWFKGYGQLIILDHSGGYFSLYAHASEILVRPGDDTARGQVIGKVGDTGSLEGPQLYFELRYKGKPLDPLAWLQSR